MCETTSTELTVANKSHNVGLSVFHLCCISGCDTKWVLVAYSDANPEIFFLRKPLAVCSSGVGSGGAGGASAPPKVLICQNPDKIPENLGKIRKNGAQRWQKNTLRPFFGGLIKKALHELCGRTFGGKRRTKTFRASLGKFGQICFVPPIGCGLLCSAFTYKSLPQHSCCSTVILLNA